MGSQSIGDRLSVVLTLNHFKLLADGNVPEYAADVMLASLLRYAPALAKCPKLLLICKCDENSSESSRVGRAKQGLRLAKLPSFAGETVMEASSVNYGQELLSVLSGWLQTPFVLVMPSYEVLTQPIDCCAIVEAMQERGMHHVGFVSENGGYKYPVSGSCPMPKGLVPMIQASREYGGKNFDKSMLKRSVREFPVDGIIEHGGLTFVPTPFLLDQAHFASRELYEEIKSSGLVQGEGTIAATFGLARTKRLLDEGACIDAGHGVWRLGRHARQVIGDEREQVVSYPGGCNTTGGTYVLRTVSSMSHAQLRNESFLFRSECEDQKRDREKVRLKLLYDAAKSGDASKVAALLEAGADPYLCLDDGSTALMTAAEAGHTAVVEALLSGRQSLVTARPAQSTRCPFSASSRCCPAQSPHR